MEELLEKLASMQQIYGLIFSLSNRLQNIGDEKLEQSELTTKQFMTIVALLHLNPGETTIQNIAKKLGSSKQNTAIIIKNLEKKGFVQTKKSATDKRALNVELTDIGKEETAVVSEIFSYFLLDVFKDFDMGTLHQMKELISKLYYENTDVNTDTLFEMDKSNEILIDKQDEIGKEMLNKIYEYDNGIRKGEKYERY
jgi:DNA-binding MarR family transcriptional regulator